MNIQRTKQFTLETIEWLWSLDTRTAEWIIGNVFIGRAIAMWLPGYALEDPIYDGFREIMPSDTVWGLFYAIIGATLWTSIIWNGRYRHSPLIRAGACTFAAAILAMMTVVFASTWSVTATAMYSSLAVSAVYCVLNIMAKVPKTSMRMLQT